MMPPINKEGRQLATQRRSCVIDGKNSVRQPDVPVILVTIGEGSGSIPQNTVDPLRFGVGVLVVRGPESPDDET